MSDERLRAQNHALNEQIKLLVRTEQRLHRSQNEIDRQVTRVELLSAFALRWSGHTPPEVILMGAGDLLRKLFRIDGVRVLVDPRIPVTSASETAGGRTRLVPVGRIPACLAATAAPSVVTTDALTAETRNALCDPELCAIAPPEGSAIVLLPIRVADESPAVVIVAWSAPAFRTSYLSEMPQAKHAPILQLMARHLEHTLRNTQLLDDLAASQRRLLAARDELEERVVARTRELSLEIGERRRAEEQLIVARDAAESASRAKSAFLANMSHELRTPLNAIIGYAELIAEEATGTGHMEIVPDLAKIVGAGRHLLHLVNDVLDLSKIEAGKFTLNREPFDLVSCLHTVVTTARGLATANHNTLETSCLPEAHVVIGDETQVAQVLLNLLGNAAKFTHRGHIRLDVSRSNIDTPEERVVFRIADTGIGMSPDQMRGIFVDFEQGDSSRTRKYGGTGLGLAISRRLCALMGGTIAVDSTEGVGSVFTVSLPLPPAQPEPPSRRRSAVCAP